MVFAETTLPYAIGEVAGFKPAAAKKLHDDGTAVPHESVYRSGSLPEKQAGAGLVNETEDETRRSAVEIPGDVLEAHGLKRMALAKKIAGRDPATGTRPTTSSRPSRRAVPRWPTAPAAP